MYQKIQVHTSGLEAMGIPIGSSAAMLFPILKNAVPADILADFKVKEHSRSRNPAASTSQQADESPGKTNEKMLKSLIDYTKHQGRCKKEVAEEKIIVTRQRHPHPQKILVGRQRYRAQQRANASVIRSVSTLKTAQTRKHMSTGSQNSASTDVFAVQVKNTARF